MRFEGEGVTLPVSGDPRIDGTAGIIRARRMSGGHTGAPVGAGATRPRADKRDRAGFPTPAQVSAFAPLDVIGAGVGIAPHNPGIAVSDPGSRDPRYRGFAASLES